MNQDSDDDDIGVLIYQHAKQEAERATPVSAALSSAQKSASPCRRSARVADLTRSKQSKLKHSKRGSNTNSRESSKWMTRYKELVKYKRDMGNCNVPQKYTPNPQLGTWVHGQRVLFKNKSLPESCIAKLNKIGFTLEVNNDAWMTRYKELIEYKRDFGDCCVNRRDNSYPQLGRWVCRQRELFKSKSLPGSRIAKLNDIGFTWEMNEDRWMKRYNELNEYKHEFGDCCVPERYKANQQLATWVGEQRKSFKNNSLPKSRITKLNQIGFTWKVMKMHG
jgi:hypothetical protein